MAGNNTRKGEWETCLGKSEPEWAVEGWMSKIKQSAKDIYMQGWPVVEGMGIEESRAHNPSRMRRIITSEGDIQPGMSEPQ